MAEIKTEQEIREADEREKEIAVAYDVEERAAQLAFDKVTEEEWEKYEKVWSPAKKRWEAFAEPHRKTLRARQTANTKVREEALAQVRANWKVCPRCGTHAARYQVFCTDEKCPVNLLTGGTGRFIEGKWVTPSVKKEE